MPNNFDNLKKDLRELANSTKADFYPRFFKTGPGQYGEGDKFIGVTVPNCRNIALKYKDLSLEEVEKLLESPIHEERLVALLILVYQFRADQKKIYSFYLAHSNHINNWDLVDLSAPKIVGEYLLKNDRKILYKLAKSKNLWEKRISIIATATFIRNFEFDDTLALSKILLGDKHDLIHKAVGWMLREVGKKDKDLLIKFLNENYNNLPRTTLRYAIEIFPIETRRRYLRGEFI